jgi:hypothetical protein
MINKNVFEATASGTLKINGIAPGQGNKLGIMADSVPRTAE